MENDLSKIILFLLRKNWVYLILLKEKYLNDENYVRRLRNVNNSSINLLKDLSELSEESETINPILNVFNISSKLLDSIITSPKDPLIIDDIDDINNIKITLLNQLISLFDKKINQCGYDNNNNETRKPYTNPDGTPLTPNDYKTGHHLFTVCVD